MSKEEKKAIERLDKRLTIEKYTKNIGTAVYIKDIEIILNLIQKQQKEIEIHTKLEQQYKKEYLDLKARNIKLKVEE